MLLYDLELTSDEWLDRNAQAPMPSSYGYNQMANSPWPQPQPQPGYNTMPQKGGGQGGGHLAFSESPILNIKGIQ